MPMVQRKPKPLDAAALEAYGLKLLHARSLSVGELNERLRRRAAEPGDVPEILAKFQRLGYLDDRRFAASYAASQLENRGAGKARVLRDLRRRRVGSALAQKTVEKVYQDVDEIQLIRAFLERKFRHVNLAQHLEDPKNLASAYRKLRYAGFTTANCIRVLKTYSARAEELEEDSDQDGGVA